MLMVEPQPDDATSAVGAVDKMTQTLPQQSGNLGFDLGDEKLDFDARVEKI